MKNFQSINIAPTLRSTLERSSLISYMFEDDYVRTAYVMISILSEPESLVNKCLAERGIATIPSFIVSSLLNDKEIFSAVFGQKAADKCFKEEQEEDTVEVEKEYIEENEDDDESPDAFADKVFDAIIGLLAPEAQQEDYISLEIIYSDKLQDICEDAATRCILGKQNYLDIDNLTYSILQNENSSGYKLLKYTIESLQMEVDDVIEFILQNGNIHIKIGDEKNSIIIPKNLESCCTVWNTKFESGVESDILGRDKEIFKLWNIFSKKTKRNAILLGEAGVGKTAIVEALVQQIVNGTCPKRFKNYTVIELDVGGTVAGTKYRGELEEKLAKLKKFLENTPNLILFIDEIHQLIGAGSTEQSGFDMSGSLKPILARGDVVCIGATTTDEYKKFIEKEQAFKRRFEPVIVNEPKHNEVAKMIKSKVESLEKFHNVTLEEGLIDYIVVCASAFNLTGANPDKTIDLCDRSMAIAEMRNSKIVQRKDVDKVYEENYKKVEKWPEEVKKSIAYHEAAHYVMAQITSVKNAENVIAVSIVPGHDFLGAYIYDKNEDVVQPTYNYYLDKIMCLLAGRIAENVFCNSSNNAGASSDLEKAAIIAKKMLTEYSLDKNYAYTNVCLEETKELYNEQIKGDVFVRLKNIINEATTKTKNLFDKFDVRQKVFNVATLLLEKKIATAKELEEAFNKE